MAQSKEQQIIVLDSVSPELFKKLLSELFQDQEKMLLLQKQLLALEFMVHLTGDTAMVDTYKNVSRSIAIMNVLREKIMASVVSDFP